MNPLEIRALNDDAKTSGMLADLLIETVAAGGSVSFMHPLSPDAAHEFWRKSLAAAARGERALLGAWDGETLVGTVTLLLDCPPNQPHRAEIAKLMTRLDYRGKGIASGLMRAAEELAVKKGRTLLVLDTASEQGAGGRKTRLLADRRDSGLCVETPWWAHRHAHLLEADRGAGPSAILKCWRDATKASGENPVRRRTAAMTMAMSGSDPMGSRARNRKA